MEIISLVVAMALTGAVGGLIAGLLGVGGGIVIVPVLEIVLGYVGVDPAARMHIAVGTSLATIIPTSISSARAHHKKHAISMGLVRYWSPYIVIGAAIGTLVAGEVSSQVLYAVFAVVALLVAIKMMLPLDEQTIASDVPRGIPGAIVPAGIGFISAMMGIGGLHRLGQRVAPLWQPWLRQPGWVRVDYSDDNRMRAARRETRALDAEEDPEPAVRYFSVDRRNPYGISGCCLTLPSANYKRGENPLSHRRWC
jgi:hypothetical protein